jgi:adenosylcobinamide-GDP ribazoletransferase
LPISKAAVGCVLAILATLWLAAKFRRWLGGYTGDCLGATQQVSEIAFYLGLLADWS